MTPIRRDLRFNLPATRIRDWHSKGPQVAHFFNALSVFFPMGERFFIASVRNYYDRITNVDLKEAATGFVGQEAMHSREHEKYNRLLERDGMPIGRLEQVVGAVLDTVRFMPKSWQLAATLALEHHTAVIGHLLLSNSELLEGSDPAFTRLWKWHSLEETEHKAVAYDVWNDTVGLDRGHYLVRVVAMMATTVTFWGLVAAFSVCLIETDRATRRRPRGYIHLAKFLFGTKGMFSASLPLWRAYFKRTFHPWQHDNRHLLEQMEAMTSGAKLVELSSRS